MLFQKAKLIIVVGCGRFGAGLAGCLCEDGCDVVVIDKNTESFDMLPESYSGYQITADGSDINILENFGISRAYMVIGATGYDCTNNLVCQAAARIYHVPNVYMRLTDPNMEKIIQGYGIQVIYPFRLSMREFERLSGIEMEAV